MSQLRQEYIGDGVYVGFDGYGVTISTDRKSEHWIYLEPNVLQALNRFYEKRRQAHGV